MGFFGTERGHEEGKFQFSGTQAGGKATMSRTKHCIHCTGEGGDLTEMTTRVAATLWGFSGQIKSDWGYKTVFWSRSAVLG